MSASSTGPSFVFAGRTVQRPDSFSSETTTTFTTTSAEIDPDAPALTLAQIDPNAPAPWHRLQARIVAHFEQGGWGMSANLAYAGFVITPLDPSPGTLGNQPPQPTLRDPAIRLDRVLRRDRFMPGAIEPLPQVHEEGPVGPRLYLFNVMVALE
jgi:hypothetical protein